MVKAKSSHKQAALFDIRLKNVDHDVIVLKGSEHHAADTYLAGKIVLSVTEPLTVNHPPQIFRHQRAEKRRAQGDSIREKAL